MPFIKISGLTTATAVSATNQFEINQNGASRSATVAQVAAFARTSATDPVVLPAGTVSAPALTFTGDTNTGIYSPAADTIAFTEGGVEAMRLDASGNLLLGVTTTGSPGISLSSAYNIGWTQSAGESVPNVFRQASSAATVMANGYRFTATANGFASSFSSSYAKTAISCGTASGAITFYTDPASAVAAGTDVTPSERMRITAAGNVGVGDTNPTPVYGYTNVISVSSNYPGVQFNSAASSTLKKFQIGLGIDSFQFYDGSAAAERMRIDASGNVGIGTSSPGRKLDVVGSVAFTDANVRFRLNNTAATSSTLLSGADSGVAFTGTETNAPFYFITNNSERMRIDTAGNVGIGTSIPGEALEISRTANPKIRFVDVGELDAKIGIVGSAALGFEVNGPERMRIDASGNVGIGTASPSDPLVLERSLAGGNGPFLRIRNSAGPNVATFGPALILDNGKAGVSPFILTQSQDTNAFRIAQANSPFATFMQLTTGGDFQINSGYGSVATAYGCRAWVNFNGTGTVAIRASGNVSSITDNAGGDYTVNFTSAMPDANYSVVGMSMRDSTNASNLSVLGSATYNTITSSSVRVNNRDDANNPVDCLAACVAIFR